MTSIHYLTPPGRSPLKPQSPQSTGWHGGEPVLETKRIRPLRRILNRVERAFHHRRPRDLETARRELDQLAARIRKDQSVLNHRDYGYLLDHLMQLYLKACPQRADSQAPCLKTVANFAGLVEAASHGDAEVNYGNLLGLLLDLMTRLFQARDNDWSQVYRYLRAIPDHLEAKQRLDRICAANIREWFDAGVQNLFNLQRDLQERIREFEARAEALETQIRVQRQAWSKIHRAYGGGTVVSFQAKQIEQRIRDLERERNAFLEQGASTREIHALVESDILEFERLLKEAQYTYYLHPV